MELFPYQRRGAEWLTKTHRGGLFDEQGLGKTVQAIVAAVEVVEGVSAFDVPQTLVVVPAVVLYNWRREIARWAPRCSVQVIDNGNTSVDEFADFVVVTHALAAKPKLHRELMARRWAVLIVDEAQAFKTPTAGRTKALYGRKSRAEGLAGVSDRVWLLTGTPTPNDPSELWTHLAALAPDRIRDDSTGRMMSFEDFRWRYCQLAPAEYGSGWKVVGAKNLDDLRRRLDGFALRRRLADELDLPPVFFGSTSLSDYGLTEDEAHEFEALEAKFASRSAASIETLEQNEDVAFATWARLCGLAKVGPSVELLDNFLHENPGEKLVVFAHHREVIERLTEGLAAFDPITITGSVSAKDRAARVERFQTDPNVRVAVCNLVAGGVGITLTAARRVFFVEMSFTPGTNAQAVSRCRRIGQTLPLLVQVLTLAGSVDEVRAEVLLRKTQMIRDLYR